MTRLISRFQILTVAITMLLASVFLTTGNAFGQGTNTGTVSGVATDPTGAANSAAVDHPLQCEFRAGQARRAQPVKGLLAESSARDEHHALHSLGELVHELH